MQELRVLFVEKKDLLTESLKGSKMSLLMSIITTSMKRVMPWWLMSLKKPTTRRKESPSQPWKALRDPTRSTQLLVVNNILAQTSEEIGRYLYRWGIKSQMALKRSKTIITWTMNQPKDHHPARDMQDKFSISQKKFCLTHTSIPVQARADARLSKGLLKMILRLFRRYGWCDPQPPLPIKSKLGCWGKAFMADLRGNASIDRASLVNAKSVCVLLTLFTGSSVEVTRFFRGRGGAGCTYVRKAGWLKLWSEGSPTRPEMSDFDPIYSDLPLTGQERVLMLHWINDLWLSIKDPFSGTI